MARRAPKTRPIGKQYWYEGSFSGRGENTLARKALQCWSDQKQRCYRPKNNAYKYYGAKGIRVCYDSREFVGWWLSEQERLRLKKPTISRIDHDKDYSLENIRLEEHAHNCVADTLMRHGAPGIKCRKRVYCLDLVNIRVIRFESGVGAERRTGVKRSNIHAMASKKGSGCYQYKQTRSGLTFRYHLQDWP